MKVAKELTGASRYRHKVFIQKKTMISDAVGNFVETWINSKYVSCSIDPIQARNRKEYKTTGDYCTHIVRMRGEIDVTSNDQILFGTRIFYGLCVENDREIGVEKIITCTEKVL